MRRPMLTQYRVNFAKKPGLLSKLARLLAQEKIEPRSIIATGIGEQYSIQFLARRDERLRERLESLGVEVREDLIFQLEIPREGWELHRLTQALAERRIRIQSLYSAVDGRSMTIVLSVDEPANAVALIEKLGFAPDYSIVAQ